MTPLPGAVVLIVMVLAAFVAGEPAEPPTGDVRVLVERLGPPAEDDQETIHTIVKIGKPAVEPLSRAMAKPQLRKNAARALKDILGYPAAFTPSIEGIAASWLLDGEPLLPAAKRNVASSKQLFVQKRLSAEALAQKHVGLAKIIASRVRSQFRYVYNAPPEDMLEKGQVNCFTYSYAFAVLARAAGLEPKAAIVQATFQEELTAKAGHIACLLDLPDGKSVLVDLSLLKEFDNWSPEGVSHPFEIGREFFRYGNTFILKDSSSGSNLHGRFQVLGSNGFDAAYFHNLAGVLLAQERWAEAKVCSDKALSLEPSFASAYLCRGKIYRNLGLPEQAMADFRRAIELDPLDGDPHYSMGHAHAHAGRYDEAIKSFAEAIKLNPKHVTAHLEMGVLLCSRGDNAEGIKFLTTAINLDPTCQKAYGQRGLAYTRLGMIHQALPDLTKAIELDPTEFKAYQTRAVIYHFFLKDDAKAVEDLRRAKECAKTPKEKEQATELLEEIEKSE